jgi:hypothetical protein
MFKRSTLRVLTAFALVAGCGKKSDGTKAKEDGGPAGPTVAPLVTPTSGVDQLKRMNFVWGSEGSTAFAKANGAYRAKPRDWAAVRKYSEDALAKDAHHIGAHWLLGVALANSGDNAAAVDHLVAALAADYLHYANSLTDPELKSFLATPHGTSVSELAARIRDDYKKRIASGILLVGRRSSFKWAKDPGVQPLTSRGELYAYDRETKRYLRLTHTDDQVAGFVRTPSGSETAVLGFDKVDRPKGDDVTPLIDRAWVQVLDAEWKPAGPRTILKGPARELSVGYGAGDQLLVSSAPASGRWGIGAVTMSSIDRSTGKLAKVNAAAPTPRIVFTLEEGRLVRAPDGAVKATWTGDPPTTPTLEVAGKTFNVRESGVASQTSLALSGTNLAFATAVDPCSNSAPSLYVGDAKTGGLKHLLTAKSRFSTRWIDATTLAYEDGDGAIRLWDAGTGRESSKLENKPGLVLDVLSLAPAPLCKQAPPTADSGSGSADEPMPPEEGSGGPVTKP